MSNYEKKYKEALDKAKAYDKALKVIKDNLDALNEIIETGAEVVNIQIIKNCFYRAFPQLKESKDEKIRKGIISGMSALKEQGKKTFATININDCITWLEEQGDKDKLIKELGEYKAKYTQEVLEKHLRVMNKDDERLRKTTISFLKDFADKGYENAVECIDWLEKQVGL